VGYSLDWPDIRLTFSNDVGGIYTIADYTTIL